jgi:hypothetical protein
MAHRVHSGQLMEASHGVCGEVMRLCIVHPYLGGVDDEVEHLVGLEAEIHGLHGSEAAYKQTGHNQQHKRAGNLQPNERIAEPIRPPATPRPPSRNTEFTFTLAMRRAGTHSHHDTSQHGSGKRIGEDAPVKFESERLRGISACTFKWPSALLAHMPKATPRPPPISASVTLSVIICRSRRERRAPKAERMAISRSRTVARTSTRLATFTHASSRTMAASARKNPAITAIVLVFSCCDAQRRLGKSCQRRLLLKLRLQPGQLLRHHSQVRARLVQAHAGTKPCVDLEIAGSASHS